MTCPANENGCAGFRLLSQKQDADVKALSSKQEADIKLLTQQMGHQTDRIVEAAAAVEGCARSVERLALNMERINSAHEESVEKLKEGNARFANDDRRQRETENDIKKLELQLATIQVLPEKAPLSGRRIALIGSGGLVSIAAFNQFVEYLISLLSRSGG